MIIVGVECPICRERVSGDTTADLNMNLRDHLADVHQMKELSSRTARQPYFGGPETWAERAVTSFGGQAPADLAPEAAAQRHEVTEFREPHGVETPLERAVETFLGPEPAGETPERMRARQEAGQWRYPTGPETTAEREVTTWSGQEPSRESREAYLLCEEVREWRYPRTGPEGERGPISTEGHGGGVRHRMMYLNEPMTLMLNCSLCGDVVRGSDDEDLSDELRFHFADIHQLRRR